MVIKIYNNTILAPVKCGSRYLDKVWENNRIEFNHGQYSRFPKVKYIVLRDPLSHLVTALHTETLYFINEFEKRDDFYHQLNEFTTSIGSVHWCFSFYEYLYYYRNKYGKDIQIVKLENLTELLKKFGHDIEYAPKEYNFKKYKKWWPKEELFEILKNKYPNEINFLLNQVEIQNVYYNKLINNEIDSNDLGEKIML